VKLWGKKTLVIFVFLAFLFTASFMIEGEIASSPNENVSESVSSGGKEISAHFFYGEGCSHCETVKPFIAQMEHKYSLTIHRYELYHDGNNVVLLNKYFDAHEVPTQQRGVPALFISNSYLVGDEPILNGFEEAISEALKDDSKVVRASDSEEEHPRVVEEGACIESTAESDCLSIATVTVAALVDSVSPCSLAVLLFLVGVRPLVSNRRKKSLKVGLAFISSVFLTYTLFGLGLLSVIGISGLSSAFSVVAGLVAIFAGILYVKDCFWHRAGGSAMEVPRSLRPLVNRMIKGVTSPLGAFLVGFVISGFELPCTGGPYLFILGQLANAATRLQTIPMLLYYNFLFIMPLLLISLFLYFGHFSLKRAKEWNESNKRLLRLVTGLTLTALGILVIPSSQLISLTRGFLGFCKVALPPVLFTISFHLVFSFLRVHKVRARLFSKAVLLSMLPVLSILTYSQWLGSVEMDFTTNVNIPDVRIATGESPSTLERVTYTSNEPQRGPERTDDLLEEGRTQLTAERTVAESVSIDPLELNATVHPELDREKLGYELLLKSREFIPERGISAETLTAIAAQNQSRVHAIIQFDGIPTLETRQILRDNDVEISYYIPNYSYVASLPSGTAQSLANLPNVRAIVNILPEDKISPHIKEDRIGAWAVTDEGVYLYVQLHQDISLETGRSLTEKYGGRVEGYLSSINTLFITLKKDAITALAEEDSIFWIQQVPPPLTATNDGARASLDVNTVQAAPYNLDGTGITVTVYDSGLVHSGTVACHADYAGRVTLGNTDTVSDHSAHVAGTLGGDGSVSGGQMRGMAPNVDIISYGTLGTSWPFFYNVSGNLQQAYNESIHTYGSELATDSVGSNIAPYCAGKPGGCAAWCPLEGDYELTQQMLDEITRGSLGEKFLSVWSAGNERGYGNCGFFYNTIGIPAGAKNIITIGAVNSNDNSMTDFSSWGPVDDGRLKPEFVGPGCQVGGDWGINSTIPDMYTNMWARNCDGTGDDYCDPYDIMCGTSMATPAVSGVIALMMQQMRQYKGTAYTPWPSTVKAILAQTAVDLNNTGPDYTTGYGLVDARGAIDLVREDYPNYELIREGTIVADNEIHHYYMIVPSAVPELKVTLAWDDYPGTPWAARELVNDLDLVLIDPDGSWHYAYDELDTTDPWKPATTGYNYLDNLEQVAVTAPEPGIWDVWVWGWDVAMPSQDYSLVMPFETLDCGDTITEDLNLTIDLNCPNHGLEIGASNVALNCQGHTLQGSNTGIGINIESKTGVTIENCIVRDFDTGIYLHDYADSNTLYNNDVLSNDYHGIYIDNGWNNNLTLNDVDNNGYNGLYLYNWAKYNDIIDNDFEQNGWHGVQIKPGPDGRSDSNNLTENELYYNGWSGMGIDTDDNLISGGWSWNNTYHGFHVNQATGNTIQDCNISHNHHDGIYLYNSTNTQLINNDVHQNDEHGVYSSISNHTTIEDAYLEENYGYGVYLYYSHHNTVHTNDFYQNYNDSIRVYGSDDNFISSNNIQLSGDHGLYVSLSNDNTIQFNNVTGSAGRALYMFMSDFNSILNNRFDDNYGYSIYPQNSDNNEILNNIVNHPNNLGVFSLGSTGLTFGNNTVCGASWDFYMSSTAYTADENTCDSGYQFVDSGQPDACDFECSGCRRLEDDLYADRDLTFCPGTYNIEDYGASGVIIAAADSITLTCDGTILNGVNDAGDGIVISGHSHVTVENCELQNYLHGIVVDFEGNYNTLINNTITSMDGNGIYVLRSQSNLVERNTLASNNQGIRIFQANHTNVIDNDVESNNYGIYIYSDSYDNYLEGNTFCSNSVRDIYNMVTGTPGDDNYCDSVYNYADNGQTSACDFECSGCRKAEDDLYLSEDTVLCPYTYNIEDLGSTGIIIINADDVELDCQGAEIIGVSTGSGWGIENLGHAHVTITNCSIHNYWLGIAFQSGSDYGNITKNDASSNSGGIRLWDSDHGNITNNIASSNTQHGIILTMGAEYNTVENNTASTNGITGVLMYESKNNYVQFNHMIGNAYGISLEDSRQNYLHGNIVEESTTTGVYFDSASTNSELDHNRVCRNSLDIEDVGGNYGDNNFCVTTSHWNDDGTTGCTFTCLFGDIDVDGDVDANDLYLCSQAYGSLVIHPSYHPGADVDVDDDVDDDDFYIFEGNYGKTS